jgi:large subunit ribosomal protein L5
MALKLPTALTPSRYAAHYNRTLAADLMYLTYDHRRARKQRDDGGQTATAAQLWTWDPDNPYTKNRPARPPKGNSNRITPSPKAVHSGNLVRLKEIQLNTFVKEASSSKSQVLSAIAGFQAMTGEPIPGFASDGQSSSGGPGAGIQVVKTRKASASFKVRAGQVCGIKVALRGDAMWTFLETLVEIVLPRMKDWNGVRLPPPSVNLKSPSSTGGVVAFGLPASAMGLFPSVEVNLEQYPRLHGFNIQFITNARGKGAQDQARALVSGFRIPL